VVESGRRSGELHTIIVVIVIHGPYADLHLSSVGSSSPILQHEKSILPSKMRTLRIKAFSGKYRTIKLDQII
jgi:hypothetical protein